MEAVLLLLTGAGLVSIFVVLRWKLLSFSAQSPEEYAGLGPEFDLRRHLDGPLRCEGVIFGPTGRVASRFTAEMMGTWNGNEGVLDEVFTYDSGVVERRAWRLTLGEEGRFRADADDVIGVGQGALSGPTVRLSYRIQLPQDAGGYVLDAIDWMYVTETGTIFNRSQFRKFGITVAELVATMRRENDP